MRVCLLLVGLLALCSCVSASIPASSASFGGSPLPSRAIDHSGPLLAGGIPSTLPAPPTAAPQGVSAALAPKVVAKYGAPVDMVGPWTGVPLNPTAHLQKNLEEDKKYIASILRQPYDFGDPAACTHQDVERDERALRQIALRINHRRVALRQQQHWIDSATEGLAKVKTEIATTSETARNLAEQLDALQAQRADIAHHVRRAALLKELDATSSNLMRLKNARMNEEVRLQKKHNEFAIENHEHNQVLDKLNHMRTKQGLALGKLHDPKPYRFATAQEPQPAA